MYSVADNLHVINPAIAEALSGYRPEPIQDLVRRCHLAGARPLISTLDPLPGSRKRILHF